MIPLYTEQELKKAKTKDLLPLKCETCSKTFYKIKHYIVVCLNASEDNPKRKNTNKYCSKACQSLAFDRKITRTCLTCGAEVLRQLKEVKKVENSFCNQSCSAKYTNTHKKHGTRVSKLEVWLSQKLIELYPQYEFHFNKIDTINAELDIYIPAIKLAFELNGIYHYEPIYGQEKLNRVQNNDQRKFQACLNKGISLCSINTSKQVRFTENSSIIYLETIQEVIKKHLDNLQESS